MVVISTCSRQRVTNICADRGSCQTARQRRGERSECRPGVCVKILNEVLSLTPEQHELDTLTPDSNALARPNTTHARTHTHCYATHFDGARSRDRR